MDVRAGEPDAQQRGRAEGQQHRVGGAAHAAPVEEGRDVGVEDGVGEDDHDGHGEHRGHPGDGEGAQDRGPFAAGPAGHLGDGRGDPAGHADRDPGHQQERHRPVERLAEEGPGGHAQRQGERHPGHRDGDRPALELRRREQPGVPGEQGPGEAGGDPGEEAGGHRERVAGGQRGDGVGGGEADHRGEQQAPAAPAAVAAVSGTAVRAVPTA